MNRTLTGITWDHSRALPPLVATAQRYEETHPAVRIYWQKRTLHECGHMPIDALTERFDLVVIDHPWAGHAFDRKLVRDLKPLLAPEQFSELQQNSVGPSFDSYLYRDQLLAIPIDAATPAPSYRPDLLEKSGFALPQTFSDLISLSRKKLAVMPGFPTDLYLNFLMLCHALGGECFANRECMVNHDTARNALEFLRQLAEQMPREIFEWNPIRIAEHLSRADDFAYCCFAYSYNNYARPGFAAKPIRYANLVTLDDGRPLRSIVGGTGIAISTRCQEMELALDYSLFTGSAGINRGIYAHAGGQPSRIEAWNDQTVNTIASDFFRGTRRTQDESLVRPRYHGYVSLQEEGGMPLIRHLRDGEPAKRTLDAIDAAYRKSLPPGDTVPPL